MGYMAIIEATPVSCQLFVLEDNNTMKQTTTVYYGDKELNARINSQLGENIELKNIN